MNDDILKPETIIREYVIKRVLGRGAFGVTYLANHINDQRAVAIKEYFPNDFAARDKDGAVVNASTKHAGKIQEFQTGLEKFLEESRILSDFDSPHIVRVLDTFELNGTAFMVMQFEEGGTLAAYLQSHAKPLDETEILSILIPVLKGLKDVHARWLIHRDIKPDNIYIRRDGSPLLIDFGTARHALAGKKGGMTAYLTPGFAPPEQYGRHEDHGPWTDVYAVGATMYYCMTRIVPPDGQGRMPHDPMMPAVRAAPAFYDKELLEIVDWMMSPATDLRPKGVDEVLARLKRFESQGVETDQPPLAETIIHKSDEKVAAVGQDEKETRRVEIDDVNEQAVPSARPVQKETVKIKQGDVIPGQGDAKQAAKVLVWLQDLKQVVLKLLTRFHELIPVVWVSVLVLVIVSVLGITFWMSSPDEAIIDQGGDEAIVDQGGDEAIVDQGGDEAIVDQGGGEAIVDQSGDEAIVDQSGDEAIVDPDGGEAFVSQSAEEALQQMLAQCQAHVQANRLTTGTGGNALECYQVVLDMNADNSEALSGIEQIENTYIRWAREAIEAGEPRSAQNNLDRLRSFNPEQRDIAEVAVAIVNLDNMIKQSELLQAETTSGQWFEPEMVRVDNFSVGKYEVTQDQWQAVMSDNPSYVETGNNYPIQGVSWDDVQEYIEGLNAITGKSYRLLTEGEWERACNGGDSGDTYCGGNQLGELAWHADNSGESAQPVGQKNPNRLGIYDMTGNVWEWTSTSNGQLQRIRGGSWRSVPQLVDSGTRHWLERTDKNNTIGLRLSHD